jgi:threonine aldolase
MTVRSPHTQHFASDNYAGMCPEATHWFMQANASGHQPGYGDDIWTQRSTDAIRDLFQTD